MTNAHVSNPSAKARFRAPWSVPDVTFERLAAVLLFIAIGAAAGVMPAQSDTFWLLRAGQDTLLNGAIVTTDTLTHTVNGGPWPNHEWASQVLFFLLHRLGGLPLITAACAAAAVAAWWVAWSMMTGPLLVRTLLVAALVGSTSQLWSLRPQVLSLLSLLLTIKLVVIRREWWLPLLFAVWANFHGGVVLGVAALGGAFAGAVLVERAGVARRGAVLAASVAATCVTPLGVTLWTELPGMLARLRSYGVSEWEPARLLDPWNIPFWFAIVAVPTLAWRRRHELRVADAAIIGAAIVLLPLGLRTSRNVMPALMVAAPALDRLLFSRVLQTVSSRSRRERPGLNAAMAALALVAAVVGVSYQWMNPGPRLRWNPVPEAVAAAIGRCPPNLYNLYDDGGFLVWFVPTQPVFVDSRQDPFPPALVQAQIEAERAGDYRSLFETYQIRCAALPRQSKVAQALRRDGWFEEHTDQRWAVLRR